MPKRKGNRKKVKTFNEKLHDWFENGKVEDHEDEIIACLEDRDKEFQELVYKGTSVFFWSAKYNYKNILGKALEVLDMNDNTYINDIYDGNTALSISIYKGYYEVVVLLLEKGALIEVKNEDVNVNSYEKLVRGYQKWPDDINAYKKAFNAIVRMDPVKPDRKFFKNRFESTKDKMYLTCLYLYDQVKSGMKDQNQNSYKQRDILTVEDTAARRFFRFSKEMRNGGVAKALKPSLFSGQLVPIDGYSSRSVIIALVDKMRRTDNQDVKAAIDHKLNPGENFYTSPHTRIFAVKFTLGITQFLYEWRPKKWQRGNCIMKINDNNPEPFGSTIASILEKLTNTDSDHEFNNRTKRLGQLFLEKTKFLQPFRHFEFTYSPNASNKLQIRTHSDHGKPVADLQQAQATIHQLNGLLILWSVAEPARRLSGHAAADVEKVTQDNRSTYMKNNYEHIRKRNALDLDHIPVATMQVRALQLLSEGVVALRDVFGVSENEDNDSVYRAKYGVSTGENLINNFFNIKEKATQLANIGPAHPVITSSVSLFSRNHTKQLLREGYGIGDESDNEDYSDDDLPQVFIP